MTEQIQKAINKIDTEAEKAGESVKRIAEYLIQDVINDDIAATCILADGKSLKDCFSKITNKARKQAVDGAAMIDSETVFEWVREYFCIAELSKSKPTKTIIDLADFL